NLRLVRPAMTSSLADEQVRDVFVIGGGPAGPTLAALLAAEGRAGTLVDKDRHPRVHIGETLLPLTLPLFEELGIAGEVAQLGMPKLGIEFVSPNHAKPSLLEFGDGWHKEMSYSYQVRRSEFDHLLLRNAAAKGTEIVEGCRVTEVEFPAGGGAVVTGA